MLKLGQASAGAGFSAAPAATTGKGAPSVFGGFGANTATTGGLGASTATTGGFGGASTVGFGGFGAAKGFGTVATIGGQAQVPPYKGIKGPGFSTDWARSVNFSTLRDDVLFEELPPPLQQHLMEMYNFIQAEHDAKRFVESFLTDSMGTTAGDSSSYMELQKKLGQLTAGDNAVDAIRVDCFEREVQGQHLGLLLESCEEEVVQYSKHVWEPLAEQDFTQRLGGNRTELSFEPFQCCLRDVKIRMEEVSAALTELELAVLPNAQRQKRTTTTDNNTANTTTEPSSSAPHFSRYSAEMKPLDTATGLRPIMASHPVVQMNTTLSNELATLLNLAAWTSRLHARADAARDLFAHLYGLSEAEVLLAQQQRQMPVGPKRPFPLRSAEASLVEEPDHNTIGDIHRRSVGLDRLGALSNGERRMQYDVLLERQRQASAPAPLGANTTGLGAPAVPAAAGAAAASAAPNVAATATGTTTTTATANTAGGDSGVSAPRAGGTGGTTAFGAPLSTAGSTGTTHKTTRG